MADHFRAIDRDPSEVAFQLIKLAVEMEQPPAELQRAVARRQCDGLGNG